MARRGKTRIGGVASKASKSSAVSAIFNPAGEIHVRVTAPSGNEYEIEPRVSFRIAGEDVEWFFSEWNSEYRPCLSREKDYQPGPQFDNGKATREVRKEEPADALKLETPSPEPKPEPSLLVGIQAVGEDTEPDPVTKAAGDETTEDKE